MISPAAGGIVSCAPCIRRLRRKVRRAMTMIFWPILLKNWATANASPNSAMKMPGCAIYSKAGAAIARAWARKRQISIRFGRKAGGRPPPPRAVMNTPNSPNSRLILKKIRWIHLPARWSFSAKPSQALVMMTRRAIPFGSRRANGWARRKPSATSCICCPSNRPRACMANWIRGASRRRIKSRGESPSC